MRAYFAHRLHVQEQKAFSFKWLRPLTQRPEALPLDPAGVLPQTLNFRTAMTIVLQKIGLSYV